MTVKTIWCRQRSTSLGYQKPTEKRWRCPDCKKRFVICSERRDGDVYFWAPAHKKRAK